MVKTGVERGHRVLDDEGDLAASNLVHLAVGQPKKVFAVQRDAPRNDSARRHGYQAHQRQHGHRLAGAGLADDAQRLTAAKVEADAIHGFDRAPPGRKVGSQVIHLQNNVLFGCYFSSHVMPSDLG